MDFFFHLNHKNKHYKLDSPPRTDNLVNWFFCPLHKFVEFPPLSDIELCVALRQEMKLKLQHSKKCDNSKLKGASY